MSGKTVSPSDIDQIAVYLVKHGAFYHPAHVVAQVRNREISLVLNAAVSTEGRKAIGQEYQCLVRLNAGLPRSFWPLVFGIGDGRDAQGLPIPMFLGQWLDGYYEFHLSGDDPGQRHVVVWDTRSGHCRLDRSQIEACLSRAAFILAYAYNPLTFEAIRQWHHAAGDFVLALNENGIDLRLITVRNYAPLIDNADPDVEAILEALLLYLIEISLKLRLDRLDGIGAMACHDEQGVAAISAGFFRGLAMAAPTYDLPKDFGATVKEYVALHSEDQLKMIASAVIQNLPAGSGERDLMTGNLDSHLSALMRAVSS